MHILTLLLGIAVDGNGYRPKVENECELRDSTSERDLKGCRCTSDIQQRTVAGRDVKT